MSKILKLQSTDARIMVDDIQEQTQGSSPDRLFVEEHDFDLEHFKTMADRVNPECICVIDSTLRFVYANDEFANWFDDQPDELVGKRYTDIGADTQFTAIVSSRLSTDNDDEPYAEYHTFTDQKHSDQSVFVVCACVENTNGSDRGLLIRFRKLAAMHPAEQDLAMNIARIDDYTESCSDWFWEADENFKITWASQSTTGHRRIDKKFSIGSYIGDLRVQGKSGANQLSMLGEIAENLPFRDLKIGFETSEETIWVRLSGVPTFNDSDQFSGYRGSALDVTEEQRAKDLARQANERFIQAVDAYNGTFALFDEKDELILFNRMYADMHPFLSDELKPGLSFQRCLKIQTELGLIADAVGREDEWLEQRIDRFRNPSGPFEVEKAGNKWYRITEQRLEDGGCLKTMVDISELKVVEKSLREGEEKFRDFAEIAADWFWEMDENLKISYVSDRYESLTKDKADNVLGKHFTDAHAFKIVEPQHSKLFEKSLAQRVSFDNIGISYTLPDGGTRYFDLSARPKYSNDGTFTGFRGIGRDTTQAKALADQLVYQANHDTLTGLINRRGFERMLQTALSSVPNQGHKAILGFIDLDQFKIVNDTEGHVAGDQILKSVSKIFSDNLPDSHELARLGGDEFGILLHDVDIQSGQAIAQKLLDAMEGHHFTTNNRVFDVSASIGLVCIDENTIDLTDAMRVADIACYRAKELGRNQVYVYQPSNEEDIRRNNEMLCAAGISDAIKNDRFVLYMQPIAALQGDTLVKHHYEILLRMLDEDGGIIMPGSFIPVAENYRLMSRIDRWVIKNSLASFHTAFGDDKTTQITINLSGASMTESTLAGFISEQLVQSNVNPEQVCFEITETALVRDFSLAEKFINDVKDIGCFFALDDFGSGLSSFSYLKNFPVDYLKIDGCFVKDIVDDQTDRTMVSAINQMAHVLGMKTIAEFVENSDITDVLKTLDIDYVQGYGIGRPQPMLKEPKQ